LHRAQNTDDLSSLQSIFDALSNLPDQVVLPLHPRTLKTVQANQIQMGSNIHLIEPVSYFEMLGLLKDCAYVLSDSGGLQKEAYYAGKKCVVLRDETEWMELVDAGINKIAGVEKQNILDAAVWAKQAIAIPKNIYGDGTAGQRIVSHLV
jgi:UDP-GlcNAc3NAcA epimerase